MSKYQMTFGDLAMKNFRNMVEISKTLKSLLIFPCITLISPTQILSGDA